VLAQTSVLLGVKKKEKKEEEEEEKSSGCLND
jgi:hypothetical protein